MTKNYNQAYAYRYHLNLANPFFDIIKLKFSFTNDFWKVIYFIFGYLKIIKSNKKYVNIYNEIINVEVNRTKYGVTFAIHSL